MASRNRARRRRAYPGVEGDSVEPIETGKRLWRIELQAQAAMERRIAIIAKRQLSGDGQPMTTVQHRCCEPADHAIHTRSGQHCGRSRLARDEPRRDNDADERHGGGGDDAGTFHQDSPCSAKVEDEQQSVFHGAKLGEGEMADQFTESTSVDRSDHLAHDAGRLLGDAHLGMKARHGRRPRCRTDHERREPEQIVCLDHHRIAGAVLDATALARQRDRVRVTTHHAAAP